MERVQQERSKAASPETPDGWFRQGQADLGAGRDKAASAAFANALALNPRHGRSRIALANLLVRIGEQNRALTLLEEGVKLEPYNRALGYAFLARSFRANPDVAGAHAIADFVAGHSDFAPGHVLHVTAWRQLGKEEEADRALALFAERHPDDPKCLIFRASQALDGDRPAAAREYLERLGTRLWEFPGAVRGLVKACRMIGGEKTLSQLADGLAGAPQTPHILLELGRTQRSLKQVESAEASFRQALVEDAGLHVARLALADALISQGREAAALAELEAGLKAFPKAWPLRRRYLGLMCRVDAGRLTVAEFEEWTAREGDRPPVWRNYIRWLLARQDFDAAREVVSGFANACPDACNAEEEYARIALRAGRPEEAVRHFEAAGTPRSDDVAALTVYARTLRAAGRENLLAELLAQVEGRLKGVPGRYLAGLIAEILGDFVTAAAHFKAARSNDPKHVASLAGEARCLTRLGRGAEAVETLASAPPSVRNRAQLAVRRAATEAAIGEFERALESLEAAEAPEAPAVRVQHALLLARLGHVETALGELHGWVPETAEEGAACHVALAKVLRFRFDIAGVASHSEEAIKLAPSKVAAYAERAQARLLSFDPVGAMRDREREFALQRANGAPARRARKGIFGGLVNEMLIDPELTKALAVAVRSGDPVAETARLQREAEDSTVAALALLLSMRRCGAIGEMVPLNLEEDLPAAIPAQIIQYWDGPLPADVAEAMDRLRDLNPWAVYRRFDGRDAVAYLREHATPEVLRAFRLCRHAAEQADLLRLAVLIREGGIYVDADDICRGDLRQVLPPGARLVLYQEELASAANNVIAAAPGDRVLQDMLDRAVEETLAGASDSIWLRTGPGALSRALARRITKGGTARLPAGYHILPRAALLRRLAMNSPLSYKTGSRAWKEVEEGQVDQTAKG